MVSEADVRQVRSFNRAVTQTVGALQDRYLARSRPLGEARILWEVGTAGPAGCDLRDLRARLDLDSGYLSRLLRSLEHDRLVSVAASAADRRVRSARLTGRGRREVALLDERSDALARSVLEPLGRAQQARLVEAMGEVERLLHAALVEVDAADPGHPDAQHCLREYFAELDRRFDAGFDVARSRLPDPAEMAPPAGEFLVARLRGTTIGCGGLKLHGRRPAEIKRMWVAPSARGLGVGRRLLQELERRAAAAGCRTVRLDTNGVLVEAVALYRASGYRQVAAFNDEAHADHWFEKRLPAPVDA